jgi:hypothetical protein
MNVIHLFYKWTLTITILLVSLLSVSGQSISNELKLISESYLNLSTYQAKVSYTLYASDDLKKKLEVQQGIYYRKGKNVCIQAFGTETIQTESYTVTINHAEKMILSYRSNPTPDMYETLLLITNFADSLEQQGKLSIKDNGTNKEISISYEFGEYDVVKAIYNPTTHYLMELHLSYRSAGDLQWTSKGTPYLIIKYEQSKFNQAIKDDLFNIKRIVSIENNKVTPIKLYKTYQVYSNL